MTDKPCNLEYLSYPAPGGRTIYHVVADSTFIGCIKTKQNRFFYKAYYQDNFVDHPYKSLELAAESMLIKMESTMNSIKQTLETVRYKKGE